MTVASFFIFAIFFLLKIFKKKKSLLTSYSISEDVKYWAEFQTGIKAFDPWLKKAEGRKTAGLKTPSSLVEACEILGDAKVVYSFSLSRLEGPFSDCHKCLSP